MVLFHSGSANKQWSEGTIWLPEKCSWATVIHPWMDENINVEAPVIQKRKLISIISACLGVPTQDTEALSPIYERIPLHMQHCFSHIIRVL